MNERRHEHAVTSMCRVLHLARAGFYAWLHEPVSDHAKEDARLLDLIRHSYRASHAVYGACRIFGNLREADESCGLHRVERLMQINGIKPVRGYKKPRAIAGRPSVIASRPRFVLMDSKRCFLSLFYRMTLVKNRTHFFTSCSNRLQRALQWMQPTRSG